MKESFENKKKKLSEERDRNKINFGDVARKELGITTQVASYYLDGLAGYPNLGDGLVVKRNVSYHLWSMSKKDADEFVRRVKEYRKKVLG